MVRENILNDIESALVGIKTASGYNNDIGFVTRDTQDFDRISTSDYPFAIIQWTREDKESLGATQQTVVSELEIVIQGGIYATSSKETALNNFLDDIEEALCTDGTRGNNAWYTIPTAIEVFNTPKENVITFNYTFLVKYDYIYGSP